MALAGSPAGSQAWWPALQPGCLRDAVLCCEKFKLSVGIGGRCSEGRWQFQVCTVAGVCGGEGDGWKVGGSCGEAVGLSFVSFTQGVGMADGAAAVSGLLACCKVNICL